jgi:transmembrane sensor
MPDARVTSASMDRRAEAASRVARLHSGELSGAEEAELYEWLDADSGNREEYRRHLQIWARIDSLRDDAEIRQLAVPPPAEPAKGPVHRRWGRWSASAAAVLLATVVGVFLWRSDVGGRQLATAVGEIRSVSLSDGSRVILNTSTRLRVRMTPEARRVEFEQGEAFFDVRREPERPFLVSTVNGDVRVLGTQFNVRRTGQLVEVTVETGRVEVCLRAPEWGPASAIQLGARQRLAFAAGGERAAPVAQAAPARIASWRSGDVIFRQDALISVLNELGRYTTKRVVLEDARLANVSVTGVFRPRGEMDDVEGFLVGLQAAFPIRATVFEDHISIEGAR